MKIKTLLCTLGVVSALPLTTFAQTPNDSVSPTSSADGGAQHTITPADAQKHGPTDGPATDPAKYSSSNTQTGGAIDTGTPKDNADKNPNVDKTAPGTTSMKTVPVKTEE
ncbi:MAG TPA: hypothetical protein VIM61_11635 [Chthoniobacterales bacterium]|jgi:hypothetical protein